MCELKKVVEGAAGRVWALGAAERGGEGKVGVISAGFVVGKAGFVVVAWFDQDLAAGEEWSYFHARGKQLSADLERSAGVVWCASWLSSWLRQLHRTADRSTAQRPWEPAPGHLASARARWAAKWVRWCLLQAALDRARTWHSLKVAKICAKHGWQERRQVGGRSQQLHYKVRFDEQRAQQ